MEQAQPFGSRGASVWRLAAPLPAVEYLEQVECRVKHPLDDLFQELLENTVLIDPCLVHPEVIDKLDADHALHGVLGQLPQLLVAILPRAEVQPIRTPLHTQGSPRLSSLWELSSEIDV